MRFSRISAPGTSPTSLPGRWTFTAWFVKNAAARLSRAVLRCLPILVVAAFVPYPFGLAPPANLAALFPVFADAAAGDGPRRRLLHAHLYRNVLYHVAHGPAHGGPVLYRTADRRARPAALFPRTGCGRRSSIRRSAACRTCRCACTAAALRVRSSGSGLACKSRGSPFCWRWAGSGCGAPCAASPSRAGRPRAVPPGKPGACAFSSAPPAPLPAPRPRRLPVPPAHPFLPAAPVRRGPHPRPRAEKGELL